MFLAVAAAVLAACADLNGVGGADDLAAAQARWDATGMTRYVFQFQHSCFCAPIVTRVVSIVVVNGQPLSAMYVDSGTVADTTLFRQYLTVPRIFAFLRTELDGHPATFTATYDAALGYPLDVSVDPIAQAADDEFSIHILSVTPAP